MHQPGKENFQKNLPPHSSTCVDSDEVCGRAHCESQAQYIFAASPLEKPLHSTPLHSTPLHSERPHHCSLRLDLISYHFPRSRLRALSVGVETSMLVLKAGSMGRVEVQRAPRAPLSWPPWCRASGVCSVYEVLMTSGACTVYEVLMEG